MCYMILSFLIEGGYTCFFNKWMEQKMQVNAVTQSKSVSDYLHSKPQANGTTSNPVLARLINEVKNDNATMAYDRVHNRHNRGR